MVEHDFKVGDVVMWRHNDPEVKRYCEGRNQPLPETFVIIELMVGDLNVVLWETPTGECPGAYARWLVLAEGPW